MSIIMPRKWKNKEVILEINEEEAGLTGVEEVLINIGFSVHKLLKNTYIHDARFVARIVIPYTAEMLNIYPSGADIDFVYWDKITTPNQWESFTEKDPKNTFVILTTHGWPGDPSIGWR